MVITIRLHTAEELKLVEPFLAMLRTHRAQVKIQKPRVAPAIKKRQENIQALLQFIGQSSFPVFEKIEIPSREERNARR